MGAVPDWYPLVAAARYLRVPPWDLFEASTAWRDYALAAMRAEARARERK